MVFLLFSYNKHVCCVVHCIHVDYILYKHCVVMTDMKKKKENLSESNFGHTEDEWGTEKKKIPNVLPVILKKERKI